MTEREKKLLIGLFISILILIGSIVYRVYFSSEDRTTNPQNQQEVQENSMDRESLPQ